MIKKLFRFDLALCIVFVVIAGGIVIVGGSIPISQEVAQIADTNSFREKNVLGNSSVVSSPYSQANQPTSSVYPRLPYGMQVSPYGITTKGITDDGTMALYAKDGIKWLREKILWTSIETAPDSYDWAKLDDHIAKVNALGMHLIFVIYNAPSWHMINCRDTGKLFAFGEGDIESFAGVLAKRYNGKTGHGYIDGYEIGDGDFDGYWDGDKDTSQACRDGSYYAPVLKKGYEVIKQTSPNAFVGMSGLTWESKAHEKEFLEQLFASDPEIGNYFDYGNIHYENTNIATQGDPRLAIIGNLDYPSLHDRWKIMRDVFISHGLSEKGIWVSQIGWGDSFVPPSKQLEYLTFVIDEARSSHVVDKVFWELNPVSPNTAILDSYKQYLRDIPVW